MSNDVQTFWLNHLEQTVTYNKWVFSEILSHIGSEVLEVGCGTGNFTVLLADQCRRLVGVDSCGEYLSLAKTRFSGHPSVEICEADATWKRWECAFDTVVMLDVLEHIQDDLQVLSLLAKSLKPEGKIVIKVPALEWLYGSMDKAIGHSRRYSKRSLLEVLDNSGFSHCSAWFFNVLGIAGWWLNGKILKRSAPPSGQVSLFNRMVHLARPIEATLKPPVGLSLFAVGAKKQ